MRWLATLAFLAAFSNAPAFGQTPEVLTCMESGYTEDQQGAIDAYVAGFDINSMEGNDALAEALGYRAADCAGSKYADDDALMAIIQYQFSLLSLRGIEATRPDIGEVIRRIDEDLEPAARERLFTLFEISVFGDPETGEPRELTLEEDEFFSNAILDPPVSGTVEQAELIGAYMAARVMMRDAVNQISTR
ncbi:hypothetical protein [Erythrobacter sp. THAF29]|uniref:hypothetical protein n=1 Tax=Erythrobacter sp. THAF29 TaxID=2587851 RepID=UPI001268514C|nr:hypothetical protein [Erythrobacter sp. THAF29]QFT78117.1 hypothetical protein FIU90_11260 [Erythrobacter sp. THAF29]